MIEGLKNMGLVTPIFTLIGVLIGTFLSFMTAWILKSRETRLKISGQLIEKRIEAHEQILSLAKTMRATVSLDKVNSENEYITYPIIFNNKQNFQDWRSSFFLITNQYSHWLDLDVTRELFYIQDYITNLDKRIEKTPENNYISIGIILRNDFLDMATCLEKTVINYFDKGWRSLRFKKEKGRSKYPKNLSLKRLNNSNLFKRHLEIYKYLNKEEKTIPRSEIKKNVELYNIAPNGLKVDMIMLREIPNVDNSGVDYEIVYKDCEDYGSPIRFGKCDLILGNVRFDYVDDEGKYLGVNYKAIKLLTKWIEENLEDLEFENETIEYDK